MTGQTSLFFKHKKISDIQTEVKQIKIIENNKKRHLKETDESYFILEMTNIGSGPKYCHLNWHQNPKSKLFIENKSQLQERFDYLDSCGYKNCYFTCDERLANESDVLLFHEANLYGEMNEVLKEMKTFERPSSQIWVFKAVY